MEMDILHDPSLEIVIHSPATFTFEVAGLESHDLSNVFAVNALDAIRRVCGHELVAGHIDAVDGLIQIHLANATSVVQRER